ncbi:hypothetical protein ACFWY5_29935 [Nonomuraea sp. NPDC059007]
MMTFSCDQMTGQEYMRRVQEAKLAGGDPTIYIPNIVYAMVTEGYPITFE